MSSRASKSGVGHVIEKKMEDNYDREEAAGTPMHIVNWVNGTLEGQHDPCTANDWKTVAKYFQNGVALCKLINVLLTADKQAAIAFQKKVMSPFVAMTNIENFNKGVLAYGLAKEACFDTGDLYEMRKGPFYNVVNALSSLGFQSNSKMHMPAYTGEITKTIDRE